MELSLISKEVSNIFPPTLTPHITNISSHLGQHPRRKEEVENTIQQVQFINKSLNLTPSYVESIESWNHSREIVQNWFDQCGVVSSGRVSDLVVQIVEERDFQLFLVEGQTGPVGYALRFLTSNGVGVVLFCNFDTAMKIDMMSLGLTSKGKGADAAGCFGEGMKIEINRLVARGIKVMYFTSNMTWDFLYKPETSMTEVLHMESRQREYFPHTLTLLIGAPDTPLQILLDPSRFLFLQPQSQSQILKPTGNAKLEFLVGDSLEGKVFVRGIQTMHDPVYLKGFGLNFIGGPSEYEQIGFGRDRNHVDLIKMCALIPASLCGILENQSIPDYVKEDLLCKVYRILEEDTQHMLARLGYISLRGLDHSCLNVLVEHLIDVFFKLRGDMAYPITAASVHEKEEALFLGATAVPVTEGLQNLFQLSPRCPNLSNLWDKHSEIVLGFPDWKPLDDGEGAFAESLLFLVDEFFSGSVSRDQIKFKRIPGNKRVVVPFNVGESERVYAVDVRLLHINSVHDRLLQEEGERCSGDRCGCIRDAFVRHLLEAAFPGSQNFGMRDRINRRIRRRALSSLEGNLSGFPPTRSPNSPPSQPSSPTVVQSGPVAEEEMRGGEETQEIDELLKNAGDEQILNFLAEKKIHFKGPDRESLVDRAKVVLESGASSGIAATIEKFVKQATSRSPHNFTIPDQCRSSVTMEVKGTVGPRQRKVFFESDVDVDPLPLLDNPLILQFDTILNVLESVYEYRKERVHIFWQDGNCIAFNKEGELYFNFQYFLGMLNHASSVHFWFVVFAHEVAHNTSPHHNKLHESAMEYLLIARLPTYLSLSL